LSTLAAVVADLAAVTGLDPAAIEPDARLDGDLRLDSLEVVALGERLRDRYGDGVDLPGYVAGLDLDAIIGLTVAGLLSYLDTVGAR
jgi:hypothetical protein